MSGQGVAEDSAVSPLAVKQNGALINDSLSTRWLAFSELQSYPKVTHFPFTPIWQLIDIIRIPLCLVKVDLLGADPTPGIPANADWRPIPLYPNIWARAQGPQGPGAAGRR